MTGGTRTHTIGVYLGLSPSSFLSEGLRLHSVCRGNTGKLMGDLSCGNFSFTATPLCQPIYKSFTLASNQFRHCHSFIVLLFCGTIANLFSSRFQLYDDILYGLCRIFHRNLFEYIYLRDKPYVFCHCHNHSSITPNGAPSANVYSSNTESALRDNDSLVDNAI